MFSLFVRVSCFPFCYQPLFSFHLPPSRKRLHRRQLDSLGLDGTDWGPKRYIFRTYGLGLLVSDLWSFYVRTHGLGLSVSDSWSFYAYFSLRARHLVPGISHLTDHRSTPFPADASRAAGGGPGLINIPSCVLRTHGLGLSVSDSWSFYACFSSCQASRARHLSLNGSQIDPLPCHLQAGRQGEGRD